MLKYCQLLCILSKIKPLLRSYFGGSLNTQIMMLQDCRYPSKSAMKTVLFSIQIFSSPLSPSFFPCFLKKQKHSQHCEQAGWDLPVLHSPFCYHFGAVFWLPRKSGKIQWFSEVMQVQIPYYFFEFNMILERIP